MQSPEFSEKLKQKLSHYPDLPHGRLQIEILETAALSKAFNMKTVAEGVATEECFSALLDMGCEIGQGYFIAYPMPIAYFLAWYKEKCNSVR
jgi:EAL domain-containing protein (putative c-di-GMP-specific phosphodiesterase class I)